MIKKIVGYARVASPDAHEALQLQITDLQSNGVTDILAETVSGGLNTGAEFEKLMQWIQTEQVAEIVVIRFDRLTRCQEQLDHFLSTGQKT